jgi:carbon-monoxide dehydrogenase large subunit
MRKEAMSVKKFGIGQPIRRVEDVRLLTGGGQYTADYRLEKELVAYVLRSPYAHARFTIKDVSSAKAIKGVKLVLIADDVTELGDVPCLAPLDNDDGSRNYVAEIPVLAKNVVKYVGDAVAFIVAETLNAAKDAAEAIEIEYSALPAVPDIRSALVKGAPSVWDQVKNNVVYEQNLGNHSKVDGIFAKAHRVLTLEIENNRLITNYMETRGAIGDYDAATKTLKLTVSSQGVHGLRDVLAKKIMKVKPDNVQVFTGDVGGGFGTKSFMYREYPLVLEAARRLKRPVKWIADRADHFLGDAHGRDNITTASLAVDKSGKFLALKADIVGNLGAYCSQFGPYIHYLCASMMTGVYKTPEIAVRLRAVYTNTVPVDAYRGAGRPEAAYNLERLVDYVARELDMKPEQIRRKNFIPPSAMPFKTPIGKRTYDTGNFDQHMTQAMEVAHWSGFKDRLKASKMAGKLRGIGLATYIECTAWGDGEQVAVDLEKDGTVTIYSGTQSNGQGHATAYAQFASQHLDLPLDKIKVVQGDTVRVATGHGTGGSRSIPVGGVSTFVAAKDLSEKLKKLASDTLETNVSDLEIVDGTVRVAGTDKKLTFADIAKLPAASPDMTRGLGDFTPPDATYPNGTHVAEVEIDPATGVVEIVNYTICDDFGIAINPLLLAGQVHGGVAQGIGQALMEHTVYDKDAQLISASLMDYTLPRADTLPNFHFETKNVPSTTNPLGIKGAGEAGSIGSTPAIMNAVIDALDHGYGIHHLQMPATPHRIFEAIQSASRMAAE